MKKIIKATGTEVVIFDTEKDEHIRLNPELFNFAPIVRDEVEVYMLDGEYIINKVQKNTDEKININIVNENNSVNNAEAFAKATATSNASITSPVSNLHRVNKWLYIAFAIFLGLFGVHHFYAGYSKKGFVYLLFSWTGVTALLALFQGISAMFKTADSEGKILV